jgi:hypothetical protein
MVDLARAGLTLPEERRRPASAHKARGFFLLALPQN